MIRLSRRQLARYAAQRLRSGESIGRLSHDLASVLVTTKREKQAELLISDIAWELEISGDSATATVTAARALPTGLRSQISSLVKKSTGVAHVKLDERVDESVLGGIRVETATKTWDKTARKTLTDIREAF